MGSLGYSNWPVAYFPIQVDIPSDRSIYFLCVGLVANQNMPTNITWMETNNQSEMSSAPQRLSRYYWRKKVQLIYGCFLRPASPSQITILNDLILCWLVCISTGPNWIVLLWCKLQEVFWIPRSTRRTPFCIGADSKMGFFQEQLSIFFLVSTSQLLAGVENVY